MEKNKLPIIEITEGKQEGTTLIRWLEKTTTVLVECYALFDSDDEYSIQDFYEYKKKQLESGILNLGKKEDTPKSLDEIMSDEDLQHLHPNLTLDEIKERRKKTNDEWKALMKKHKPTKKPSKR